jgi:hypothetical protein
MYHHPEIDHEKEEICDECRGDGRTIWCHRMVGGHEYQDCFTCGGSGKTIKRPKCRIESCNEKQDITSAMFREKQSLDPNALCKDHARELRIVTDELGKLEESRSKHNIETENICNKLAELKAKMSILKP